MRINISLFVLFFTFSISFSSFAQLDKVKIEDFVSEHSGFEENEDGEIVPINIKEINKKIRFLLRNSTQTLNLPEILFGTHTQLFSVPQINFISMFSLFKSKFTRWLVEKTIK